MNQILENKKDKLQRKKFYITQFYISFFVIIFVLIYFSFRKFSENNVSEISNTATRSYNITRLYSNAISPNFTLNSSQEEIIGTISIPKLNLSYPIFSRCTDELLKISVCRFYGPDINTVGNLCIIGHNYNNRKFFSNLYLLEVNDIINIYGLDSNIVSYSIYEIFEVEPDNLDYLNQETKRCKRNYINYLQ